MKYQVITLLTILFFHSSLAQHKQDRKLANDLDKLLSASFKNDEPGISLLIAKSDAVVYEKAFGSANIELGVALRSDMVFNLGSITKQFTAVAILQLVEQGKLMLEDSIQKYPKNFPSKGYKITINNLLTHTSGIKDYMQIDYQSTNMERWYFKPANLVDSFKNVPLEFEPGTRFRYSNSGYFLLGYIIEMVTGQSYSKYVQENILDPLSLTHTYFDSENALIPNRVSGYKKEDRLLEKADFWSPTIAYAAGGLISGVEDLFKWHKGLYAYKILKKETLAKAFEPFHLKDGSVSEYGYGWFIKSINGIKSIEHDGAITGFLTREVYYPDEDIFIASLFNCDCAPKDPLSVTISGIALGKPLQPDIKISEAILDSYIGTYELVSDPKRTITILKINGLLGAKVSGQDMYQVIFASDTRFAFKNLLAATGEFILENGKVTKFVVTQNGKFEWRKR